MTVTVTVTVAQFEFRRRGNSCSEAWIGCYHTVYRITSET